MSESMTAGKTSSDAANGVNAVNTSSLPPLTTQSMIATSTAVSSIPPPSYFPHPTVVSSSSFGVMATPSFATAAIPAQPSGIMTATTTPVSAVSTTHAASVRFGPFLPPGHSPLVLSSLPPVRARGVSAVVTPAFFKERKLRSGKWITEEEKYAELLISLFEKGHIADCENGVTLRSYLSQKLHCAPMRISKKFAGKGIGKLVYLSKANVGLVLPVAERQELEKRLAQAEHDFYKAICIPGEPTPPSTVGTLHSGMIPPLPFYPGVVPSFFQHHPFVQPAAVQAPAFVQASFAPPPSYAEDGKMAAVAASGSNLAMEQQSFPIQSLLNPTPAAVTSQASGAPYPMTLASQPPLTHVRDESTHVQTHSLIHHVQPDTSMLQAQSQQLHPHNSQTVQMLPSPPNMQADVPTFKAASTNPQPVHSLPPPSTSTSSKATRTVPAAPASIVKHDLSSGKTDTKIHNPASEELPDFLAGFDKVTSSWMKPVEADIQSSPPFTSRSFDELHRFLGKDLTQLEESNHPITDTNEDNAFSKATLLPAGFDALSLFSAENYALLAQETAVASSQHEAITPYPPGPPSSDHNTFDIVKMVDLVGDQFKMQKKEGKEEAAIVHPVDNGKLAAMTARPYIRNARWMDSRALNTVSEVSSSAETESGWSSMRKTPSESNGSDATSSEEGGSSSNYWSSESDMSSSDEGPIRKKPRSSSSSPSHHSSRSIENDHIV